MRFVNSDRCKGVLQFFKSIFREEDFNLYEGDLKNAVKAKIVKLEKDLAEAVQKLSRTNSQKTKVKLEKSIDGIREAITDWKSHLQNPVKLKEYYLREWRTFHGSDHLPLWVELEIDFSDSYLAYLKTL